MSKHSFLSAAVLLTALFAACQSNPTRIDSTVHQHEGQSSDSHASTAHSNNHNGSIRTETNHNTTKRNPSEHDSMNHSEMNSAPNAAAQPYDLQFLDTMIAHYQGAVEMAKPAETKAQNAELKILAAKITADQEKEIAQMKTWREQWFAGKPSALNMEMTGMADSMRGMNMAKLNSSSGTTFDIEFINQMTPHHQGAIVMAREASQKSEHAEIKQLAGNIIKAQEAEIKQMQNFKITEAR